MNKFSTLMRREWLQHRFAWALLTLLPMALALLALSFTDVQFSPSVLESGHAPAPPLIAFIAMVGAAVFSFLIVWVSSLFIATGIARRDNVDRSIEFWLSLPVSDSASLGTPLLVHLLLAPAVALMLGSAAGVLLSAVLTTRMEGFADWLALPWATLLPAVLTITLRLLAGLVLATLWLSPLVLSAVLARAYIGRWGIPVLALALGLGSQLLARLFGQPLLSTALTGLLTNALAAMIGTTGLHFDSDSGVSFESWLDQVPPWAGSSLIDALRDLATPMFVGAMLVSAACFALLVQWRRRGAGAGGD